MQRMTSKRIVNKLQSLYFNGRLIINGKVGLPAQTSKEIRMFKAIFDNYMDKKEIRIFEWGSGFSTIYYAEYLRKKGAAFKWRSIDNNRTWHEKIKTKVREKNLQSNVALHLLEFVPFWEKPEWGKLPPPCGVFSPKTKNEKDYVRFPVHLNEDFDIIIIDARFRRHCIQTTKEMLLSGGIAIMHDAQKSHYHIGLDEFRYNRFFQSGSWYPFQQIRNQVWIGSMENPRLFDMIK